MAHCRQTRGYFLAVFQGPGDQDMHEISAFAAWSFGRKGAAHAGQALTILGIETSCDETAAAVVRGHAPGPGEILSNIVFSQTEAHAPYGGVVPEIASRAHLEILDGVIGRAPGRSQNALGRFGWHRRHGRPRPDRRGDGGTDHRQGPGPGQRQAA